MFSERLGSVSEDYGPEKGQDKPENDASENRLEEVCAVADSLERSSWVEGVADEREPNDEADDE